MEHWEALKPGGFRMVWEDGLFRPGTDTFALSAFPRLKAGLRVCDLGSGTGLLGLCLLQRQPGLDVTGVEIQPEAASLAEKCAAANGLDGGTGYTASSGPDGGTGYTASSRPDGGTGSTASNRPDGGIGSTAAEPGRLGTLRGDLRQVRQFLPPGGFDLVVSNPPYYQPGRGGQSPDGVRRLARSGCTLDDVIQSAAYLLRHGGAVCLCQKPDRLTDALCLLRAAGCEPKRLRTVCQFPGGAPSLILLEGRRGGRPGLTMEPSLALCREDGTPSPEADRMYFREL